MKNLDGGFEVKNFSYTCSLFKGDHSMENKIIKYGIILLHKYEVEQTEVISRLLFIFFLKKYFFHGYYITSLGNIHPNHILKVHKALNQSAVKSINMFFLRKCKYENATF